MRQSPQLVVVSGDFTQLGTEAEFAAARDFLDRLTAPVFAVPGNHDVPVRNILRRFLDPYGLYRRYICEQLEPFLEIDGVAIAGIKTARRARAELNWAHGSISRRQLTSMKSRFEKASPDALRVVVAHHPLLQPEGPMASPMRPVRRADQALETFADLGVRLVLSGHFHLSYVRKHVRPGVAAEGKPIGLRQAADLPILVAQASSTISTRLRGDTNAYNLIDMSPDAISVTVREWRNARWTTREHESVAVGSVGSPGL